MSPLVQIVLFASDVPRMRDFYREQLGLTVLEDQPGWVRLDAGGVVLALHGISFAVDVTTERGDTALKLCFRAADLEAARSRLLSAGTRMRDIKRFGDVAFCDGVDPEGNVFQLTTR